MREPNAKDTGEYRTDYYKWFCECYASMPPDDGSPEWASMSQANYGNNWMDY